MVTAVTLFLCHAFRQCQLQVAQSMHWRLAPFYSYLFLSVLWLCCLGCRKGIRPVKNMGAVGGGHWLVQMEWRPAGWSVCLPLLIFPCIIKSRSTLLAPAHAGGPGKRAVKWLWSGGIFMVALCNRADHYIFALWFLSIYLSSFFIPRLISAAATLDVYHTSTHGVALVRI